MYASRKPTIDARIVAATTAYPVGLRSFTNVSGALLDVSRRIAASVVAPTRDSDDRPTLRDFAPGEATSQAATSDCPWLEAPGVGQCLGLPAGESARSRSWT